MDGRHEAMFDTECLVENLASGARQLVVQGVRDDLMVLLEDLIIDFVNDHRIDIVFGGTVSRTFFAPLEMLFECSPNREDTG